MSNWRVGDGGFTVFGPKKDDGSLPEVIASIKKPKNARLIAAAPEMLDALKDLRRRLETCDPDGDCERPSDRCRLCSLIAKAEGRE